MNMDRVERCAQHLVAVRRGEVEVIAAHDEEGPANLTEAYAVQERVMQLLKQSVGAWKVGGPLHGQPMFAPVFAKDVSTSPAKVSCGQSVGIECEIAFLLKSDLPPSATDYAKEEIIDAVGAVLPLIETVTSRLQAFETAPVFWKLADNQVNGGLVLGDHQCRIDPVFWRRADISLGVNGKTLKQVKGANPGGDSLELLRWLANAAGAHCGGLNAGQIVTTGSYTGIDMFDTGTSIQADFGPLGRIEIQL